MDMKKKNLTLVIKLLLTPALMILLGIVLMVRPDSASALVGKLAGWGLIAASGVLILEMAATKLLGTGKVIFAAVTLAAGVWLLRNPLAIAAAIGRIAGLLILIRAVQDMINASRWKCGMRYAIVSTLVGAVLILLPMTTSRIVMVVLGLLVTILGVLTAVDRLKIGKLLPDGDDIIDV